MNFSKMHVEHLLVNHLLGHEVSIKDEIMRNVFFDQDEINNITKM